MSTGSISEEYARQLIHEIDVLARKNDILTSSFERLRVYNKKYQNNTIIDHFITDMFKTLEHSDLVVRIQAEQQVNNSQDKSDITHIGSFSAPMIVTNAFAEAKVCDCGAVKSNSTHYDWCSTKK